MLYTDMSSSMSMEGAELVDGMAAEVDSVGSRSPSTPKLPGSTLSTGKSTMCVRLHVRSQRVSKGGLKVALACTSFQCCKLAL